MPLMFLFLEMARFKYDFLHCLYLFPDATELKHETLKRFFFILSIFLCTYLIRVLFFIYLFNILITFCF